MLSRITLNIGDVSHSPPLRFHPFLPFPFLSHHPSIPSSLPNLPSYAFFLVLVCSLLLLFSSSSLYFSLYFYYCIFLPCSAFFLMTSIVFLKYLTDFPFTVMCWLTAGHFTQVVWKGSKEVGIGRAQSNDGTWIVVANFFPAGNYVGQHASNVFPAKKGKVPKFMNAKATGRTG